jgi:hypothetical protein
MTLELLAQLSFDNDIRDDINASNDFQTNLAELEKIDLNKIKDANKKFVASNIKTILEQIKWNLGANTLTEASLTNTNINFQQVTISYNVANLVEREFLRGLKNKLESLGFKIWFNANGDSSLYEITKAIENSYCVLMSVTEKYRQSVSCQIEAQHGFRLKKKIIPMLVQTGIAHESWFRGWMGSVLGADCVLIDFVKNEYDECVYRIKHELDALTSNPKSKKIEPIAPFSIVTPNDATKTSTTIILKPEDWTEAQVKDWFIKNDLNLLIFDYFRPCSGKILKQMHQMNARTPEFYNQSMKEIKNIKFNMIVLFTACLDELFK